MSPFFQFFNDALPALSQMLAVYGFGIAFFLFISQTETYNRVAWFCKRDSSRHAWLAIFNTSRRFLVKDQIYKGHLIIDARGAMVSGPKAFGEIKSVEKLGDDGTTLVDIDYMERKSALVYELSSVERIEVVQLRGIIKDGRMLETSFGWDDFLHSKLFNIIFYIILPAIVITLILLAMCKIGTPCGALWTYGIGMAGLPLGIYLYFRKHRRIFSSRFRDVKRYIEGK